MTPSYQRIQNTHLIYNPEIIETVSPDLFDPELWRRSGKVKGEAPGRGTTFFVSDGSHDFALRHFKRGGLISKLISDRYVWQGLSRTRAWCEWHLLQWMFEQGLPVPRPAAAHVVRQGWTYRADLLTLTLPHCQSLAVLIRKQTLSDNILERTGQTIKRFHDAGIYHADLNAHNILVNREGLIYVIDFDRGCHKSGNNWKKKNLSRLHRSFSKINQEIEKIPFPKEQWTRVIQGYKTGQDKQTR